MKHRTNDTPIKGYRFRIYPTKDQEEQLARLFGSCRYVWNRALAEVKEEYADYTSSLEKGIPDLVPPAITSYSLLYRVLKYRNDPECLFLQDVSFAALQQPLLNLGKAFTNFFRKRARYPSFKKRSNSDSCNLTKNIFTIKDDRLQLIKIKGLIEIGWHRKLPGYPSSAVISKSTTGKYYISFICEYGPEKRDGKNQIGIDLGLKDFIVTSDGVRTSNPKCFKNGQKLLKRRQQALSRKIKGSNNRKKARLKVAKQHERIANQRNDFLHKLSRKLINENQVIGVETLRVKNMVKNRRLSKSISDAAWAQFTRYLAYKAIESQNTTLVHIDPWYPSSHICSNTDEKLDRKLKLSERSWRCPACKQLHDRDINAAINIKHQAILNMAYHKVPLGSGIVMRANAI